MNLGQCSDYVQMVTAYCTDAERRDFLTYVCRVYPVVLKNYLRSESQTRDHTDLEGVRVCVCV